MAQTSVDTVRQASTWSIVWGILLVLFGTLAVGSPFLAAVAVNVVMPGFVHTPMSERFRGAKPGLMSPERAATLIRRGLERNRARIAFPRTLAWGMWWLSVLPPALSQRILSALGYGA